MKKVVVLLSGGIDSASLLFKLVEGKLLKGELGRELAIVPLFIDYGHHTAKQEKEACIDVVSFISGGCAPDDKITFLPVVFASTTVGACALKNHDVTYDDKHPAYVPFRNMLLLSLALSITESYSPHYILMGVHNIDTVNCFPDCSQLFESRMQAVVNLYYNLPKKAPMLLFPFCHDNVRSKAEIMEGVPQELLKLCFSGYGDSLAAKRTNESNTKQEI